MFKARHPDVTNSPNDDDPDFVAVRDAQVARVRASIEKIVMTDDPDDVEVDVYPDMEWTADGGEWSRAAGGVALVQHGEEGLDATGLVRTYGPQLGLGTLALMSLFLMMRVVRKSSQAIGPRKRRLHETKTPPEEEPLLTVGPHAVGQAEVSESMLTGKEVDASTLRHQELAQEVSKMVEDDPDGTADLIRRWAEET